MRAICLSALLVAALPVHAAEPTALEKKAAGCWIVSNTIETRPAVEFDVTFDASGNVTDVHEINPQTDTDTKAVAQSASSAIRRCGPYEGQAAGASRLRMDPAATAG